MPHPAPASSCSHAAGTRSPRTASPAGGAEVGGRAEDRQSPGARRTPHGAAITVAVVVAIAAEPAKDCVRRMLVRDPRKRATAVDILRHEWMRENGVATDNPIELEVLTRIKKFSGMNKLKKEALKVRRW